MASKLQLSRLRGIVQQYLLSWSSWKFVVVAVILANLKTLPLAWHLRIFNGFRFLLPSQRPKVKPSPALLFQPMITSSRNPLSECDYNIHKSNSTYFADLDISRTHLVCTLLSIGIEKVQKDHRKEMGGKSPFNVMLGAVSCSFRKEIKPLEKYEMWSRVLCWDKKWFYVVTHFVRKGAIVPTAYSFHPSQTPKTRKSKKIEKVDGKPHPAIFASALTKYVFKKGRLTIPPEVVLQASRLLPSRPESLTPAPVGTSSQSSTPALEGASMEIPLKVAEKLAAINAATEGSLFPDDKEAPSTGEAQDNDEWGWDKIEKERARGMKLGTLLLGLDTLEEEFREDTEVLAEHHDI